MRKSYTDSNFTEEGMLELFRIQQQSFKHPNPAFDLRISEVTGDRGYFFQEFEAVKLAFKDPVCEVSVPVKQSAACGRPGPVPTADQSDIDCNPEGQQTVCENLSKAALDTRAEAKYEEFLEFIMTQWELIIQKRNALTVVNEYRTSLGLDQLSDDGHFEP